MGISVVVMAAIGIGQVLVGDGRFLFLFEHPTRSAAFPAKGTFTNQNHFAHFMALGIGPLLWWWHSRQSAEESPPEQKHSRSRSRKQHSAQRSSPIPSRSTIAPDRRVLLLIGAGAGVVALAAVLSVSRGILVFALAAAVATCAVLKDWKTVLRLVLPLGAFVAIAVVAFGTDELNDRLNQLSGATSIHDVSHGRWMLWTALAQAVTWFWPAGSGVGSHADVYPVWMSEQFDVRFSHAECGYLQILLETGIPGTVLLAAAIGLCGLWCLQGWRRGSGHQRRRITALTAGLLASLVHSLFDFVWYIPGCMILTLTLVACLCRSSQLARTAAEPAATSLFRLPTLIAAGMLLLVLPVGRLCANTVKRDLTAAPHWQSYHASMLEIVEGADRDQVETFNQRLDKLIGHLEACLAADPLHQDAWSAIAPLYLQRFEQHSESGENQMTLQDVRDTVQQAEFASRAEARDWLARAFGDDAHDLYRAILAARRGLRQRPLHGESYLVLAETMFLASTSPDQPASAVELAVKLRPHEPRVLYAAGLLAEDSGDTESAWHNWRYAAALDSQVARRIILRFVDRIPVDELMRQLEPNEPVFCQLYSVYSQSDQPQARQLIATEFARAYGDSLQDLTAGASDWKRYAEMLLTAEREAEAVLCLKRAVRLQPQDLSARRRYALLLVSRDQLREARRELTWLAARLPDDRQIAETLAQVESHRHA